MKPAVFLDRDGTLIRHVHHLCDPQDVVLVDGAANAVRRLRKAGFACVVVTNQSVVGRGMLTVDGLERVHDRVHELLADGGAALDGVYYCPQAPTGSDQSFVTHHDRKPGPGMLLQAAEDLDLALDESWMVGDTISDMFAGRNAGCCATILVQTGLGSGLHEPHAAIDFVTASLPSAVDIILAGHGVATDGAPQVI